MGPYSWFLYLVKQWFYWFYHLCKTMGNPLTINEHLL